MVFSFGYGHLVCDRRGDFVFLGLEISLEGGSSVFITSLVIFFGLVFLGLGMGLGPAELMYLLALWHWIQVIPQYQY